MATCHFCWFTEKNYNVGMQKVEAQSLGFHIAALVLLAVGAVLAVNLTREPDVVMMKVNGQVVESRVVARGAACRSTGDETLLRSEPSPVRNNTFR